jgi:hypothetical protein
MLTPSVLGLASNFETNQREISVEETGFPFRSVPLNRTWSTSISTTAKAHPEAGVLALKRRVRIAL